MENKDLQIIEDQIGYIFKNRDLLQQAFVRRSYARENGGEDNEVLEFIGDKALDFVVVKLLADCYGYFISDCEDFDPENDFNEFACEYREGKLTEIKKHLVEKKTLAHRIDILGLSDFLIMGKGDAKNNIAEQDSVKEDLFEAIIGAVALDSDWDLNEIESTVEIMLDPESELSNGEDTNYVQEIQDWTQRNNNSIPLYHFEKGSYQSSWYVPFDGVSQNFNILGDPAMYKIQYHCLMKLDDDLPIFRGFGASKSEARKAVCKVAYDYLDEKSLLFTIQDEIEEPSRDMAINQLEILARRGYFSIPTYEFFEEHDENGNPIWRCECHINEKEYYFHETSSSKKDAKKGAAYSMLLYVLGMEKE